MKKVEVTPSWTITTLLNIGASTSGLTSGPSASWSLATPWDGAESGTAKEVLLTRENAVTEILLTVAVSSGCGVSSVSFVYYRIYAYHDNFADSANADLRTLQMNAGN